MGSLQLNEKVLRKGFDPSLELPKNMWQKKVPNPSTKISVTRHFFSIDAILYFFKKYQSCVALDLQVVTANSMQVPQLHHGTIPQAGGRTQNTHI